MSTSWSGGSRQEGPQQGSPSQPEPAGSRPSTGPPGPRGYPGHGQGPIQGGQGPGGQRPIEGPVQGGQGPVQGPGQPGQGGQGPGQQGSGQPYSAPGQHSQGPESWSGFDMPPGYQAGPGGPHFGPGGPQSGPDGPPPGPGYGPGPQGYGPPGVPPAGAAGGGPGGFPPGHAAGSLADRYSPDALRRAAQVACPILVLVGLSWPESGEMGWTQYLLWAVFAAAASIGQLSSVTKSATSSPSQAWTVSALCTGGLLIYWVLIVLPAITSNGGFLQTLGVFAAATSLWLTPRRV